MYRHKDNKNEEKAREFVRLLLAASKKKPRREETETPGHENQAEDRDLPDSSGNSDRAGDGYDGYHDKSSMSERPRENHISGTGGPVVKTAENGTESLTDAEEKEKTRLDEMSDTTFGQRVGNIVDKHWSMAPARVAGDLNQSAMSASPWISGGIYGSLGLLGSMGFTAARDWWKGTPEWHKRRPEVKRRRLLRNLAVGVGAGLLGGGLSGAYDKETKGPMEKQNAFFNTTDKLVRKISSDPSLSPMERSKLIDTVTRLPSNDQQNLLQILGSVTGAGIGAAIMRFLMKSGKKGMIAGALLGGLAGTRLGAPSAGQPGTTIQNGFPVNNNVDIFGRAF